MKVETRSERLAAEVAALADEIQALDDDDVSGTEVRRAQTKTDTILGIIDAVTKGAERLREHIARLEAAADSLEDAASDLQSAADALAALEP